MEQYRVESPNGCLTTNTDFKYAKEFLGVVQKTDAENWDYFSEDVSNLIKDFMAYGTLSRLIVEDKTNKAVGYIQCRALKATAPQLLQDDLYNKLNLSGSDLWVLPEEATRNTPLYVDVIAVDKEHQNNIKIIKAILQALYDIVDSLEKQPDKTYAVGVTYLGRKMCKLILGGKGLVSKVERTVDLGDGKTDTHERALYEYSTYDLLMALEKLIGK